MEKMKLILVYKKSYFGLLFDSFEIVNRHTLAKQRHKLTRNCLLKADVELVEE